MCLHIGMAGPRPFYQIERRGHRRGYNSKDVDGELLEDDEEDPEWVWAGCPDDIESGLSIRDVMLRWKGYSPVRNPFSHQLRGTPLETELVLTRGIRKTWT